MIDHDVLIIDFNNLAWRAAHVHKSLSHNGVFTGLFHGVFTMLEKIVSDHCFRKIVFCADEQSPRSTPLWRTQVFSGYKVKQKEDDPKKVEFRKQTAIAMRELKHAITSFLDVEWCEYPGYEADDLIAEIAARNKSGTTIISSDKDLLQLVEHGAKIVSPHKDNLTIDQTTWSVNIKTMFKTPDIWTPENPMDLFQFRCMVGDPSDCVPGIPSVGEVTAAKIMRNGGFAAYRSTITNPKTAVERVVVSDAALEVFQRNAQLFRLPHQACRAVLQGYPMKVPVGHIGMSFSEWCEKHQLESVACNTRKLSELRRW